MIQPLRVTARFVPDTILPVSDLKKTAARREAWSSAIYVRQLPIDSR